MPADVRGTIRAYGWGCEKGRGRWGGHAISASGISSLWFLACGRLFGDSTNGVIIFGGAHSDAGNRLNMSLPSHSMM